MYAPDMTPVFLLTTVAQIAEPTLTIQEAVVVTCLVHLSVALVDLAR